MDNFLQILETFLESFALLIMLVSLAGMVVPIFPGVIVIWLVALLSVAVTGGTLGWVLFGVITLLAIAGTLVDNFIMGKKALDKGAAWLSLLLALVAGVAGSLIFPPVGGIIAAPLVLLGMEYWRRKSLGEAWEVVKALLIGWGWAFAARAAIGLVMIIIWAAWAFTR